MATEAPRVKQYKLRSDHEFRFEVVYAVATIELVDGSAEIFGFALGRNRKYTFQPGTYAKCGFRGAIFTYHDATLEVIGTIEGYISQHTPMVICLNTHAALEECRRVAEKALEQGSPNARGPRIMLTGPTDVGKSTVCRVLCNYAIRQKRTPVYVDLDIGQGSISIPGTVGAVYVEKPVDPLELFIDHNPIVCNFGHVTPSANVRLYDKLVMNLARLVDEKCDSSKSARLGGVIINTCGWVKGEGYEYLIKAAEAFQPDIVVVLDHERLFIDLERDLPAFVKVLLQPKSGGVEARTRDVRTFSRHSAVQKYFYGTIRKTLHPFTFEIPYDKPGHELDLFVYKVGQEQLPESCLPVGVSVVDPAKQVLQLPFDENLLNHVLALVPNESKLDSSLPMQNVLGFAVVTALNADRKTLTVLSPQTHPLPSRIAIFSDVTYYDQ